MAKAYKLVGFLFWLVCLSQFSHAQFRDDFESGGPRLRVWRDDCNGKVVTSNLTATLPHRGLSSEMVEFKCSTGTYMHFEYPLPPSAIIEELQLSLYMRSAPSGLRPAFRVIFPRTAHPATSEPLTTLLYGTKSSGGGKWSEVMISNVETLLATQQRILRSQFGAAVDLRGAFIDALILDVYNGPSNTKLQIDELIINGLVPANSIEAQSRIANISVRDDRVTEERLRASPAAATDIDDQIPQGQQVAERARDLRASVPRWIDYRGESLDWLQSLGFNGLVLREPPNRSLLLDAQRLQLAIIAPPPALMPNANELPLLDVVQAWSVGWLVDKDQQESIRALVARTHQFPAALQRPTIVEALEHHSSYGRMIDLLAVPTPSPSTLQSSQQLERMMRGTLTQSQGRTIPLTSMVIEPSIEWRRQVDGISSTLQLARRGIASPSVSPERSLPVSFSIDAAQARMQWIRSITDEARGWYFRTLAPLDEPNEIGTQRSDTYRAILGEIELLSPWLQSGEPSIAIPIDSSLGYTLHRIAMPKSQLVILQQRSDYDTIAIPIQRQDSMEVTIPKQEQSVTALRITRGRLEQLPIESKTEGWRMQIPEPNAAEFVVLTNDARAIEYLQRQLREFAPVNAEFRMDIAEQTLQTLQRAMIAEQIPASDNGWRVVNAAESELRSATQYLMRGDLYRSITSSDNAWRRAQEALRGSWERAVSKRTAPQSSIALTALSSLPIEWALQREVRDRQWMRRSLPGFDLKNKPSMEQAGWQSHRRLEDRVASRWSIESSAGTDESSAILLQASSIDNSLFSGGYAGTSMLLSSPRIDLPQGSLVRLQGKVRMLSCGQLPQSGVLIYETTCGSAFGQLVNLDRSDINSWQRFQLDRYLDNEDGLQLQIEVRGVLQAVVDDLTIESLLLSPTPMQPTRPLLPDEGLDSSASLPSSTSQNR